MASLAVLRMVDDNGQPALGEGKPVHPFFKPKSTAHAQPAPLDTPVAEPTSTPAHALVGAGTDELHDESKPEKKVRKRRKGTKAEPDLPDVDAPKRQYKKRTKPEPEQSEDEQQKPGPKKRTRVVPATSYIANHFAPLNRGSDPATVAVEEKEETAMGEANQPTTVEAADSLFPTPCSVLKTDEVSKQKKVMKFNPKTGTIGSPPKPKPTKIEQDAAAAAVAAIETPSVTPGGKKLSRLVKIEYGRDETSRVRIGLRVDAVLSSPPKTKSPQPPKTKPTSGPASPRIKKSPAKIAHPFFGGRGKLGRPSNDPPMSASHGSHTTGHKFHSSTPTSPVKRGRPPQSNTNNSLLPKFSIKSMGLRVPGAKEPAWPWKDMVHVRGDTPSIPPSHGPLPFLSSRKSKGHAVDTSAQEGLLHHITQEMGILALADSVRNIDNDNFIPPPPELRLPRKHFESGRKLQRRVLPELKCSSSSTSDKQARSSKAGSGRRDWMADRNGIAMHPPSTVRLFDSIGSSLSAFDKSECETACWVQKYAPVSAAEVIQPRREAFFLREWLQALVVQSVDTGSGLGDIARAGKEKDRKPGTGLAKKGRKRKKTDDFIVTSDEEGNVLDEVSDGEFDCAPSGKFGVLKKTVIRTGNTKGKRLANTIVISGPHGCGKTAAVYAVAKELDFEVFEINSSSRRSGRDVDDRIGDMLKHHHVSHQNARPKQKSAKETEEEVPASEDEVAKDIKSGKQKTMASFFIKTAPAAPTKPVKPAKAAPAVSASTEPTPATQPTTVTQPTTATQPQVRPDKAEPSKGQKQSLILLDEVDILYDEDKQFWTRVIELIVKSKRPFVMTCNDETLVPLQSLNLHGIFRFSPPPTDLAVDRLLLIAANEGHALRRDAVEALYESRHRDLRAATMDLNYWCQIGVGDRRGGFDWFYPRWPKGVDLDENQEVVRVVSEDSYQLGMGWLGRDVMAAKPAVVEEELTQQSWHFWKLDAGERVASDCSAWAHGLDGVTAQPGNRQAALAMFDQYADAVSAADICSSGAFGLDNEELLDATTSDLSPQAYGDYILGLPVLDTPPLVRHDVLPTLLPMTMRTLARASSELGTDALLPGYEPALHTLDEERAIGMLRNSFTTPPEDGKVVSRIDFSMAFDAIAAPDSPPVVISYLEPSVFDRNMEPIALDVAPYVRSIVAYDSILQQQRLRLSNLVSEGGRGSRGPKRMRTTRAALSAMEGGSRSTTRAEKWFKADMNPHLVMRTGGSGWGESGSDPGASSTAESGSRSPSTSPVKPKQGPRKGNGRKRMMMQVESDDDLA